MWSYVDEQLKKYLKEHKTNDRELEYRIQNVFNMGFEFSSLFNYADKDILKQFKTRLRLFKENYTKNDYVSYMVNKYQNRTRTKNNEILRIMLLMEYAEVYQKNYENQMAMFDEIASAVTKTTIAEVESKSKGFRRRRRRRHPYIYEKVVALHILGLPNNLGVTWDEHVASIIDYNSEQAYKQAVIDLREGNLKVDTKLIENQTKREINYKPSTKNIFSGQVDNEAAFVLNEMKRQIYEYYGVEKVRIVGVLDEKTCEICEGYIGKVYNLNDVIVGEQIGSHPSCRCYIEIFSFK